MEEGRFSNNGESPKAAFHNARDFLFEEKCSFAKRDELPVFSFPPMQKCLITNQEGMKTAVSKDSCLAREETNSRFSIVSPHSVETLHHSDYLFDRSVSEDGSSVPQTPELPSKVNPLV